MKIENDIVCKECGKQVWAINLVNRKDGVDVPDFLHAVCYERLKKNSDLYIQELEKSIEGII